MSSEDIKLTEKGGLMDKDVKLPVKECHFCHAKDEVTVETQDGTVYCWVCFMK